MAHNRHLRFLITSALLVGPAMGCGGPEPEVNTVGPIEAPTEAPVDPEPEPEVNTPSDEDLEALEPVEEPPRTNERAPVRERTILDPPPPVVYPDPSNPEAPSPAAQTGRAW